MSNDPAIVKPGGCCCVGDITNDGCLEFLMDLGLHFIFLEGQGIQFAHFDFMDSIGCTFVEDGVGGTVCGQL